MKSTKAYFQHHLLPSIPVEFKETIHQQLLDRIYTGLFWLGIFMPLFIILRTLKMYDKVPLNILLPWAIITSLVFLSALPLRKYYQQYRNTYKSTYWYRWLFSLSFFASLLFGATPWLMYEYLNSSEIILFSAVLSFGVVIQIMVLSGFISVWLFATLPVLISVAIYSFFYWDFNPDLGRYFAIWIFISSSYMFFMALHHNKTQIELLVLRLNLTDANNAKSRFLAVMSHEVRTPLSSIIGMTDLLSEEALTTKQTSYTNNIKSAGNNLLHVLNNVLLMSSLQAKQPSLKKANFIIRELVNDVVKSFAANAKQKKLQLIETIDKQVPDVLFGDSARLRQILMNLLANAIKFTDKGEVKILVNIDSSENIHFSICDTGIGIDEPSKKLIFKEFSQVNPVNQDNFEGVGLGLTIVTELVRLLQGKLTLKSEINKGSCFHITLPLPAENNQANQIQSKNTSASQVDLLLIEDDALNREITSQLLRRYGHQVHESVSAEQALQWLQENTPQLIITDLNLPKMSGIELAKIVKKSHPKLPIVALTANTTHETTTQCLAAGMQSVLLKPIEGNALDQAIFGEVKKQPTLQQQNPDRTFSSNVILELSEVMSTDAIKELYSKAITQIRLELKDIEQQEVLSQSQLHRLTGACANFGFTQLSQELTKMQVSTDTETFHQKQASSLLNLLQETEKYVIDFIKNHSE